MGKKRQDETEPGTSQEMTKADKKSLGRELRIERAKKLRKEKHDAKRARQKERLKLREELGDAAPPKEQPRTIENTREYDETMVDPDDKEVLQDEMNDEFAPYFNRETTPKVLITMSPWAKVLTWKFCFEIEKCIPNSKVFARKGIPFKKVVKQAMKQEYTDIVVVHEDRKTPNALVISHLPEGPTAYFKINSLKFTKDIKKHGASTCHYPEVILNNFNTRLGHSIGRMLAALFPHQPQFTGRRVVTFHNQRDYVFFRHHRYEFKKNGEKAALHELGPRFTLRLKSLQKGTFDSKFGEYEWVLKRHEMETTRRRFFL